ncbi:amidase signature domain-containing protein [Dioszegia hungarica]|uniref:Amidase signature domain-containing protein n=1 Tax=Dioszegia hungarica TaxID=4972 RepID=A0AA38LRB8_9TREE|nr:amidase signature domain-containing protein [Dioszegia hungarica]KAI9634302.1 amidase signature domain-containing protein [Dioszegia hungarica]
MPLPASINLLQTSITELSLLLDAGTITSVDLVGAYIDNIEKNNIAGLGLHAIIQVAPLDSVFQIAAVLDQERRDGAIRGPLHGIPILVKDNIATASELGMATSAGNTALLESVVSGEAEAIKRMRNAGAIILAKTNLTELSNFRGKGLPHGWSAVGGQTSSAYVQGGYANGGDPIGSSSGSAVGISAGFGAIGLGTETFGSIVNAASRAALYCVRPTTGLIPNEGTVPVSYTADTIGPMGFTSTDVAIVLDTLAQTDGKYLRAARVPTMAGLQIGLVRRNFLDEADGRSILSQTDVDESIGAVYSAVTAMRQAGADINDVNMDINAADCDELLSIQFAIWRTDIKEDMAEYLGRPKTSPVRTLAELVEWNLKHAAEELPPNAPNQDIFVQALNAPPRDSDEYRLLQARAADIAVKRGLDLIFEEHKLDAAIFVTELGIPYGAAPLGNSKNGAPFGITFAVKPNEEEKLISIMSEYESITPQRRIPDHM